MTDTNNKLYQEALHERADELVQEYLGTSKGHTTELQEELDKTPGLSDLIDQEMFLCAGCGWWCEPSERADDDDLEEDTCTDCYGD